MEIKALEPIKSVKILGKEGCSNCTGMFQHAIDIASENNIEADIQHVTDFTQIAKYGVMSLPGLVINEKVVSYGRILTKKDIMKFMGL